MRFRWLAPLAIVAITLLPEPLAIPADELGTSQASNQIPTTQFVNLLRQVLGKPVDLGDIPSVEFLTNEEAAIFALQQAIEVPYDASFFDLETADYEGYDREALNYLAVGQQLNLVNVEEEKTPLTWGDAATLLSSMRKACSSESLGVYPDTVSEHIEVLTGADSSHKVALLKLLPMLPSWLLQDFLEEWSFVITIMSKSYPDYAGYIGLCHPKEKKIVLDANNIKQSVLFHEMGHYFYLKFADRDKVKTLYDKEGQELGDWYRKYSTITDKEFFADAFYLYLTEKELKGKKLEDKLPLTYKYITQVLAETERKCRNGKVSP